MTIRIVRCLAICSIGLVGVLASASPASAHAQLVSTSPADGAILSDPPGTVEVQFSEAVQVAEDAIIVFDSAGERVDVGSPSTSDGIVSIGLKPEIGVGSYVVIWHAISADAHPVRGSFIFSVGSASAPIDIGELGSASGASGPFELAADLVRLLTYAAVLIAVGGAVFALVVHDGASIDERVVRQIVQWAAVAGILLTGLGLLYQAGLSTGRGYPSFGEWSAISDAASTSYGRAAAARVLGMLALAVPWGTGQRKLATAVGAAIAVSSFVLSGHAATTSPRPLVTLSTFAHVAAGAAWLGGLVALAACLRRRRSRSEELGTVELVFRFSDLAAFSVVAVGVCGLALAWAQIRTLDSVDSSYGLLVVAKVAIVATVASIAGYNRRALLPRLRGTSSQQSFARLRRTVMVESALIVVVLGVTAVLATTEPPRAAAATEETSVFRAVKPLRGGEVQFAQVELTVDPARAGTNTISALFTDSAGVATDPGEEVTIHLVAPGSDGASIDRTPRRTGPGAYELQGPELVHPGPWSIEVRVRVSAFTLVAQTFDVEVG